MKNILLILSLLCIATGFSQNISTEAPSVSASAVTVPQGFLQGELSTSVTIENNTSQTYTAANQLPFLLLRYGLTDRFELRMQHNTRRQSVNGKGNYRYTNFGIGAKYAILPNDGETNLAAIVNYSPYTGTSDGQQGDFTLAFSQIFKEKHAVGANLGYSLFRFNPGEPNPITTSSTVPFSLVYGWNFASNWTAFGEFYSGFNRLSIGGLEISQGEYYGVDFGLQFILQENIQLDWVSGFSLSDRSQFHSLGFNIYFNTKKH